MPVRFMALDLDGTLLNSRGAVSDRTRSAITEARQRGVRVALVTGRRFRDVRPLALELGLDVPVIAHNGALTKHARTLETVAARLLPLAAARAVIAVAHEFHADALVSDDPEGPGLMVFDEAAARNESLLRYAAWARRIHGPEADEAMRCVPSLTDYLDHPPLHIGFSGACGEMQLFYEALTTRLGGQVKVLATIYPRQDFTIMDVLHPEASKGAGVAAAAAEAGIAPADIMAIGDNHNDLEMLEYAGLGVLMGNADTHLRKPGLHLTATNDEDGVALAIERFVFGNGTGSGRTFDND